MFGQDTKVAPTPLDRRVLHRLISPSGISFEKFYELAEGAFVEQLTSGFTLFKEGDRDEKIIYVLSGKVVLSDADGQTAIIGGESSARVAIRPVQPRTCSATCATDVSVACFDYKRLEAMEGPPQTGIDVSHISENEEKKVDLGEAWMARVLQSDRFKYIPPV